MSEQPPADMLRQGGNAALQSLNQVATQAVRPAAPSVVSPAMPGGALPAPDASAAIPSEVAGPAEQAMAHRDATAATAKQSASDVEAVRDTAGQVASAPVLFTAGRGGAAREQRRAAATEMVSTFLGTVGDRAHQILNLGAQVPNRLLGAASQSVGAIAATVEGRTRAVSAQIVQLRAKAKAEGQAAQGMVASQHSAASANITQATSAARQQLSSQYNATLQAIQARETAQLRVIDDRYRQGDERFRNAGRVVGDEAVRRGEQMAADYMRGLKDEDDNFWDGPLTYNRGKARADAAHEVSQAYQKGLVDEANKQADQAQQGKGRDIEAVHTTANQAREALQKQYNATLSTLGNAESTALRQASEARSRLASSIATALRGGEQALASQEVALIENLRAGAQTQAAGLEQQAHEQVGAWQKQIGGVAAGVVEMGSIVADQVHGPPPPLDELSAALAQATAEMDAGVGQVHAQIDQGQTSTSQQITQAGQGASARLTSASEAGMAGPTQAAGQVGASLGSLGQSSVQTFSSIHQSHAKTTSATVTATLEGFTRAVDGVQQSYDQMSKGLDQGFSQNATALEDGLRGALPKMESEIRSKADEAASHVAPRWKSIVKWVLIIAVIVVVALVIGPFVIGVVGAALGTGAIMTGIIAGAIVGAATSATIQVINNWADNKPLLEGVGKAALIGAIGGAVGGGFGAAREPRRGHRQHRVPPVRAQHGRQRRRRDRHQPRHRQPHLADIRHVGTVGAGCRWSNACGLGPQAGLGHPGERDGARQELRRQHSGGLGPANHLDPVRPDRTGSHHPSAD